MFAGLHETEEHSSPNHQDSSCDRSSQFRRAGQFPASFCLRNGQRDLQAAGTGIGIVERSRRQVPTTVPTTPST